MLREKILNCSCGKQLNCIANVSALPRKTRKEREYWSVGCLCGIVGPVGYSREDAIKKWNDYQNKRKEMKLYNI